MKRHALTDPQWELLAPFFPPRPRRRGGQWTDDRTMLDGINVRAARAAAGAAKERRPPEESEDHALGRSRGGFGTKIHLVSDGHGLPSAAAVTAGQRHESKETERVLN